MKKLILIDGNSLLFRAYFATAYSGNLMKTSRGIYTNALYAFTIMMLHVIEKYQFSHILVAFDAGKTTFRHKDFTEYKGGRKPLPSELLEQIPLAKDLLDILHIKRYELELYEADDIIGTLSKIAEEKGFEEVEVISSDKDLLQLVSKVTHVCLTQKGLTEVEEYTVSHLKEVYNLSPSQIIDLKGLMGDASDNIPGVKGVGEKTAIKLLSEYGTVENLLNNIDTITGKLKEKIQENKDLAILSKKLATIYRDVPLNITIEDTTREEYDGRKLIEFLQYLEFNSLLKKVNVKEEATVIDYKIVGKKDDLTKILIPSSFIIIETFGQNYHKSEVLGLAIVNDRGNFFIPFDIMQSSLEINMFLADDSIKKNTFDYKKAYVALKWNGYELNGVEFDLLTATYIVNPSMTKEDLRVISSYFNYNDVSSDDEIYGKNTKMMIPSIDTYALHSVKKALAVKRLKGEIVSKITENEQSDLYFNLELPLTKVLADMEYTGIKLNTGTLDEIGKSLEDRIKALETDIHRLANKEFNISSPKQLGEVLFEDLKLESQKKTKTGYSTSVDVLEKLVDVHPIIEKIILYRTLTKLFSTYVVGLKEARFSDNKIHTIFNQALTATGRLSSTEPNLQNIPIRYEEGRLIRKAFVPTHKDGYILSADYSQIELRVLAHISQAKNLMEAFLHDLDIHTKTAMDVFHVKMEEVTSLMRRQAKAVNFGIIYGISAFGLSENLGISPKEAASFIATYLDTYPGIKDFMELIVKSAKLNGYVETIFNRRRYIPELLSKNFNERSFGERTAMNAPIQGSAADIIKLAMINVFNRITKENLKSKLLIQVHDELVLDVANDELERVKQLVKEEMEGACTLLVPLKVDINYGPTWYEAK